MRFLLDTHIFIWIVSNQKKIPASLVSFLNIPEREVFLSLASIWEIQIKTQIGKLQLDLPLPELLEFQQRENDIKLLPIELDHIWTLQQLPLHHGDPFDRILIAQSLCLDLPIRKCQKEDSR